MLSDARDAALIAGAELGIGRSGHAAELAAQIDNALALCARITMYAKADALAGNEHGFAGGVGAWADYLIETGRICQ
ncbi:hypothetical protein A5642_02145 [Mycolicibacterium mucogenicum]|uniref:Uncharacterized protein n=1 Tax=Mycolicibacterium mucogenicum TaxID=56689 RepID=A0A1A0MIS8_MYCMU|nr:hypothetical protein [Mycolicibacterium mucogenicum]OBA85374.1 hypothetical protein A5642_02145 [Mycolicibacterium mucogenicum]